MKNNQHNYIVAAIKPWNIRNFYQHTPNFPGNWQLFTKPEELNLDTLRQINPRYIFFPHWSWIVPEEILSSFECVCFHMTDVPYGRGGSPLQNLIVRGHKGTKLTALKMTTELDAGPVYVKEPLELDGSAQDIFNKQASLCYKLIEHIIQTEPVPVEQYGEITSFKRRTPAQSLLPETLNERQIYDYIRMLDAETYPKAFIKYGDYRLEFSEAKKDSDGVSAKVIISTKTPNNQEST